MSNHKRTCPAYGNYQPPYAECNCGAENRELRDELDRQNSTTHALNLAEKLRKCEAEINRLQTEVDRRTKAYNELAEKLDRTEQALWKESEGQNTLLERIHTLQAIVDQFREATRE